MGGPCDEAAHMKQEGETLWMSDYRYAEKEHQCLFLSLFLLNFLWRTLTV